MRENRAQSKAIRDLERQVRAEMDKSRDVSTRGSPINKRSVGMMEYDYNIQKVKRGQKVQKVGLETTSSHCYVYYYLE